MNVQGIRNVAKYLRIKTGKLSKTGLVQSIQLFEGNFDCFATAYNNACDQPKCTWRKDCFTQAKKNISQGNYSETAFTQKILY